MKRLELPGDVGLLGEHFVRHLERECARVAEDDPQRTPHPNDRVLFLFTPAELTGLPMPKALTAEEILAEVDNRLKMLDRYDEVEAQHARLFGQMDGGCAGALEIMDPRD